MAYRYILKKILPLFMVFCFVMPAVVCGEPADAPQTMRLLLGLYDDGQTRFLTRERDGKMELLFEQGRDASGNALYDVQTLETMGSDQYRWLKQDETGFRLIIVRFLRDASAQGVECRLGDTSARRVFYGANLPFQFRSGLNWETLKQQAKAAMPPTETGTFLTPDLVSVTAMDNAIQVDVRYGKDNNKTGVSLYDGEQAFLQRPAAEALARVQQKLKLHGYGLLVYDAYRPWFVTKMLWDAAAEGERAALDDPTVGSPLNRGASVDVSLYDLVTGDPAAMASAYEEMSPRATALYAGGTELERWRRDLLRQLMAQEGFVGNADTWWRFDYRTWRQYPVMNKSFDAIAPVFRIKIAGYSKGD